MYSVEPEPVCPWAIAPGHGGFELTSIWVEFAGARERHVLKDHRVRHDRRRVDDDGLCLTSVRDGHVHWSGRECAAVDDHGHRGRNRLGRHLLRAAGPIVQAIDQCQAPQASDGSSCEHGDEHHPDQQEYEPLADPELEHVQDVVQHGEAGTLARVHDGEVGTVRVGGLPTAILRCAGARCVVHCPSP